MRLLGCGERNDGATNSWKGWEINMEERRKGQKEVPKGHRNRRMVLGKHFNVEE
jgi:hypothetical protein